MLDFYDYVVVGSGPAAFGALLELSTLDRCRVAIVTGAMPSHSITPHAKIASVCFESRKTPGLTEGRTFTSGTHLHSTAQIGGLAAYWGQQFQRYSEDECWEVSGCKSYEEYIAVCERIESYFRLVGGVEIGRFLGGDRTLSVGTPRLLVGTCERPVSDLNAMEAAITELCGCIDADRLESRVNICEPRPDGVELRLSDGNVLYSRKVILAAGVVGSANILLRSIPHVKSAEFSDHAPYMLYSFGSGSWLGNNPTNYVPHFNARTLILRNSAGNKAFASVYQMSQAPVSLLFTTFGLKPFFRGCKLGSLADLIRPIQVWTSKTFAQYRIDNMDGVAELLSKPNPAHDSVFLDFRSEIRSRGLRSLVSSTPPGHGFHYHNLRLVGRDGTWEKSADAIKNRFGDTLFCVDASTMEKIACRPHTLTMMVHSVLTTRKLCKL